MPYTAELAALPIMDTAHLNAMTGGDHALANEVLDIFLEQTQMWTRLLDPKGPANQWADGAHTIKGASLGIGAMRLAKICEITERRGREDGVSVVEAALLISDLKDIMTDTKEAVARAAHQSASSEIRDAS